MPKYAIVLVYDGKEPSRDALLSAISALAEYQVFDDPKQAQPVVMSEGELVAAIAAKAISDYGVPTAPSAEDWSAAVLFEQFEEALIAANYQELGIALATRLSLEYMNETDLVKAVRVLCKEDAEMKISQEAKINYHLSQEAFKTIRRTHQLVCQGRHLIIR